MTKPILIDFNGKKGRRKPKDKRFKVMWRNMIARCYNPKDKHYKWYGERGITVQDSWKDNYFNFEDDLYVSYIKHVEEFGEKDTTLDRIDYNGNYELNNIRWATIKEQANNRRNNFIVVDNLTLAQFSEKYNIPYYVVANRIKLGWSVEKIINTPIKKRPPITILSTGETIPQFCKRTGMAGTTVRRNLAKGKSIEEIESTVIVHHYLPCKNNKMPLKQHCNQNNYNYGQVVYFINKYNLKPHEALARYLARKEK